MAQLSVVEELMQALVENPYFGMRGDVARSAAERALEGLDADQAAALVESARVAEVDDLDVLREQALADGGPIPHAVAPVDAPKVKRFLAPGVAPAHRAPSQADDRVPGFDMSEGISYG